MRIVHVAPCAPYNEGWSYQENLLPKYHHKLGHDVTLIVSDATHQDGRLVITECCDKVMEDGVRLIRLRSGYVHHRNLIEAIRAHMNVYPLLKQLKPDYIFFHSLISDTILQVVRYKKNHNPNCVIVQDNHMDYEIGRPTPIRIRGKILRFYYRFIVYMTIKYIDRVYGVTPWRKEYAEDYFKVPKYKTDVLIMGADDEMMDYDNRLTYRSVIRKQCGISDDEFLVVSGGKIESNKNIDSLINACASLNKVRLLLFGSIDKSIEDSLKNLINSNSNVTYIGWIDSKDCYKYFYAADLVCFPGRHSVLWEQACASKVPCLIKWWHGMEHVNAGGNTFLLKDVTVQSLRDAIQSLVFTDKYRKMLSVARSSKTDIFLYSGIAKKSILDVCDINSCQY